MSRVVNLYGGAGGWCIPAHRLGLDPIGVEIDADACATRAANGLRTVRADIAGWLDSPLGVIRPDVADLFAGCDAIDVTDLDGLIASPPCPAFSAAGTGAGRAELPAMVAALDAGEPEGLSLDARLLWHPWRWAVELSPTWLAWEQVPPVLPWFQAVARGLERRGWSAWAGVLNAADYGVPQIRRRAVLLAHRHRPVGPPPPTHAEGGAGGLEAWVSMAAALGWGGTLSTRCDWRSDGTSQTGGVDSPSPTLTGKSAGQWRLILPEWCHRRPSTTVACDSRIWPPGHKLNRGDIDRLGEAEARARYGDRAGTNAVPVTIPEAAALQSFPPGWRWAGTKGAQATQIGNAIPPLLAGAVLAGVAAEAEQLALL